MTELISTAIGALALAAVALIVLCGRSSRGVERLVHLIEVWRRN